MSFDAHRNFAASTVAGKPTPPASGDHLTVELGHGGRFPDAPFNVTVWPPNTLATVENAEILRVIQKTGDDFQVLRAQEGTEARNIQSGDWIADTVTAKTLTDLEDAIAAAQTSADTARKDTVPAGGKDGDVLTRVGGMAVWRPLPPGGAG